MTHNDDTYSNFDRARRQHAQDMAVSGEPAAPVVYVPQVGEWANVEVETDANTGARAGIDMMRDAEGKRHYRAWGRQEDERYSGHEAYMSATYSAFDQADISAAPTRIVKQTDIGIRDAEVAQAAVARSRMNPATQASYGDMRAMMAEGMHAAKMLYNQRRREEADADRRAAYDREARRIGAFMERYAELKKLDATPAPEVKQ